MVFSVVPKKNAQKKRGSVVEQAAVGHPGGFIISACVAVFPSSFRLALTPGTSPKL